MSAPSAFDIGRQVGTNFANVRRTARDESVIENILSQAMQSGNPETIQNSIGQILSQVSPERQGAAIQYLQGIYNNLQKKQQEARRVAAAQQSGVNPDLPESVQKAQYENNALKQRTDEILGNTNNPTQFVPKAANAGQQEAAEPKKLNSLQNYTDDQLIALTGVKGFVEPAKQELKRRQEERNIEQKREEGRLKFGQDLAKKVYERADAIAEGLPQKESALSTMEDAIARKDMSFWSRDNLAELTGIEGLRSQEGALFKTAGKEYFLGNIARAGARPNQWIEQQIADMMAKVGRSTEANLSVARALRNELAIEKERVRLTHEIGDELESKGGDYRKLGSRVSEKLSKFAEQKQKELFNDLRAIKSIGEGKVQTFNKVEEGTPISKVMVRALLNQFNNDPIKAEEAARKLGYSIDE